jgi:capsular exopolysaccharide synthesis family protein
MGEQEPEFVDDKRRLSAWHPRSSPDSHDGCALLSDLIRIAQNESPATHDLLYYRRVLWLKKFYILRFALLGLLLALAFSFFQKPVYRAYSSIAIQDLNENFLNLKEDPTAINTAGPAESYFQTQIQILQSESLLQRVIEKPAIARTLSQEEIHNSRFNWRKYVGVTTPSPTEDSQPSVEKIASRLTVRSFGDTRLVKVYFESGDPKLAAQLVNTLVDQFGEQSHQMRWESTQRTADWLAAHLNEMKTNLEKNEAQLQAYARTSGLLFSEKGNVADDKLRQLQEEYSKAQADRTDKQAKHETAMTRSLESLPGALDDATVRDLGLRLAALHQEKAQLTSSLTPEHYKVRQVQAQIDELSSALETQRKNIARRAANEYHSARRHEELLARAYGQQAKTVIDQAEKTIHYDTLKHEVDNSRQLYDALMQRVKQAGLASAMRASNILVVDKAKPPLLPYRPNYPLDSVLGLFAGTFFGAGFSVLRERYNRRIVGPGVAPAYLNLPELGAIPMVAVTTSRLRGLFPAKDKPLSTIQVSLRDSESDSSKLVRMSLTEGRAQSADLHMMAEAFSATLTSILLPSLEDDSPGVIVLTSPGPGAGKTTIACNLGIAMAETGKRVLLVDADLRSPTLHRVLKLSNSWGLCDVLCSDNPINNIGTSQLVRHTDIQRLDLLPAGTTRESPSHLLYSPRVVELFRRLRQEYDLVLIDTPPMMHLADARALGRVANGVVLVLRSGQTTLAQAQLAVQRFADDGTHVVGTVLNGWDPKTASGTDYGDSYNQYTKEYRSSVNSHISG